MILKLGDVAEICSGITLGRKVREGGLRGIPYLRVANVKDGRLDLRDVSRIEATETEIAKLLLRPGDLLLTEGGDPDKLGRGTFWQGELAECIHQNHIFRVRFDLSAFDPGFLAYQFGSDYGKAYFLKHAKQTTGIATINQQVLRNFPLIAPPLPEQQRIAAHLKAQLAEVEAAQNAAMAQLEATSQLEETLIRESLEANATAIFPLAEVTREVKQGVGAGWASYPVLGATREGAALAREPVGKSPQRYKPVLPGTVFYNPMRINIGSIALVDEGDAPGITSPDYVALTGTEGKLHYRWFYHWLRSGYGESFIKSLARGAVRERMLYNRLAEGDISLPSWAVQVATANQLAELRPLKSRISEQLQTIHGLPQRLLAETYAGLQNDQ
ncbi:MAG: restriction endonuclease subunit S [Pseudomonadota bacterium]|nr:restriction endonuclease subunit S [Pseudomonadota bacterium]MDP1904611.1 restriction endonuclease subunit S [Pseudomonadota bacterium]MDP2353256.1 restriction endonuclease subunit S [Pseudomonadota bacterium]